MPASAGQKLLDAMGRKILRADGSKQLANGAGDACCCCPGNICFQEWIAAWSCADQAWSGPVTDNKLCLPPGTDTGWVKIAGDASGCTYRKRVPYSHCCTVNGDCSGLGDTATPALPFGGGVPSDCCEPCVAACGCFNIGSTATVSFAGVSTIGCIECDNGDGTSTYKSLTGSLGTYTLTRYDDGSGNPCKFKGDFDGITYTESVGPSSGECPSGDVTIGPSTGLHIVLGFNPGTGDWTLSAIGEGVILILFSGTVNQGDCSGPLVFSNTYVEGDNCGADAPYGFGGTATVVLSPCVPP